MVFLSQLLNKPLYKDGHKFAKVVDFAMSDPKSPAVDGLIVKKEGKKHVLKSSEVAYQTNQLQLIATRPEFQSVTDGLFYLAEDLLDKQVIDVTGKRLVRVNDVLLKEDGEFSILGIDIGFSGILRRLGFGTNPLKTVSIPWSAIEAFDYQTGDIHIKLGKNTLNTLHPADLADILEDAGTKERLGLLEALGSDKAADALEEADVETQQSILEELPKDELKRIVQHMSLTELADILPEVNPQTLKEIYSHLGIDKANEVRHLSRFAEDTAGGLMDLQYVAVEEQKTVGDILAVLSHQEVMPDAIIVVKPSRILGGVIETKDLLNTDAHLLVKVKAKAVQGIDPKTGFLDVLELFAQYNLRTLPVVDVKNRVQGVVTIDAVLAHLYAQEEEEE